MNAAFQFTESETKILLESLMLQEQQLLHVCQTSHDEDAVADAGSDLIELRLLLSRVREEAVARFGKGALEFGRNSL